MWTLAFGHHEDRTPTHGLLGDARGCDGGVREKLAEAGIKEVFRDGPHESDLDAVVVAACGRCRYRRQAVLGRPGNRPRQAKTLPPKPPG